MPDQTFTANSKIVEFDATRMDNLLDVDISDYSIRHHIQQRLNAVNYNLEVSSVDEGWPVYEELQRPAVAVWNGTSDIAGVELGSGGASYVSTVFIFGRNDAERTRLAALIMKFYDRTIPIYNYVNGSETDPDPTGEHFITDSVGWVKIPHVYNAPDAERWRAVVTANLRRVEE